MYKLPSQAKLDLLEIAEKAKDLGWTATLDSKRRKREVVLENKAKKIRIVKTWQPNMYDQDFYKFDQISNVSPEDHALEYFRSSWDNDPRIIAWEIHLTGWNIKGIKDNEWIYRKYATESKKEAIELFIAEINPERWNEQCL